MIKKNWKNYYLSFLANLSICLGVAVAIILIHGKYDTLGHTPIAQTVVYPIWVFDVVGFVFLLLTFYFFLKNFLIKKFHVKKRYFIFVYIGYALTLLAICLNICMGLSTLYASVDISVRKILLWVCIGIDGIIWIVSNTFTWCGCTLIEIKHTQKLTKSNIGSPSQKQKNPTQSENSSSSAGLKPLS